MRLTWSVPLPGPFRLSGRVGGRRRRDEAGPVVTVLAYLIAGIVALVYIVAWLLVAAATGLWKLGAAVRPRWALWLLIISAALVVTGIGLNGWRW